MKLIKTNGTIGLLIPKVFIKNSTYQSIRKNIINNYSLVNLIDFGKFPNVASDCVSPIISKAIRNNTELVSFQKNNIRKSLVNQKIFSKNPIYAFSFNITEEKVKILEAIETGSVKLFPDIAKIKRGIELGQKAKLTKCINCGTWNEAGEKYYNEKKKKKCKSCKTKLSYKNVISISSDKKSGKYFLPCLSGKQIDYYEIKDCYHIIGGLKGIDYKEDISKGNRIYIRRITTHPVGVFLKNRQKHLVFNTAYSIYNCKYDCRFLLGIFNSKLMKFYYDNVYNLGMKLTTQATVEYLKELPIVNINLKNKKQKELHDSIIKCVDESQSLTGNRRRNKIKIAALQQEIDKKVEKLYNVEIPE
jgi:hypothetical protein